MSDPIMGTINRVWQAYLPNPKDERVVNNCNGLRNCGTCLQCQANRDRDAWRKTITTPDFPFFNEMRGRY